MSAFGGKADIGLVHCICPLMTQSGHRLASPQSLQCASFEPSIRCPGPFILRATCGGASSSRFLVARRTTWPLTARAQQPALPVVGFVRDGSADASVRQVAAFRKGLNETGYVEGQNVTVEYHWLEGHYDRLPALMADLVRRRVAVIATPGTVTTERGRRLRRRRSR